MSSYPRGRSLLLALLLARLQRALPLAVSLGAALTAAPMFVASPAHACGCFAATNVASPVVQAGEKILFAKQNGMVVMQVQVEYSGQPSDFGWLLPLPAVSMTSAGAPGIEVGSQEVFDVLSRFTQPTYSLTTIPCGASRNGPTVGCGSSDLFASAAEDAPGNLAPQTPLVKQSSVGPYDYAILKADNKTEMFNWLMTNGYVIPAGTDGAVAPYIRPGAFFLALRLKAGQTAGDVQPVVLRYQADLPAVPINLTAASATPNMGVLIWVLGPARAIPRNYYNTVVDDAQLDWLNSVKNYADVVAKAVREIDGHHAFVTEFAGSSAPLTNALGPSTRYDFIDQLGLTRETDPVLFVQAILGTRSGSTTQRFALNSQLTAILGAHIPLPAALIANQVTPSDYYANLSYYLDSDRRQNPTKYADIAAALAAFDPVTLVMQLKERIVAPTLVAQTLFADPTLPKLTRLYTVLSPDDMNLDPAFSFNAELPDVPKDHQATLQSACPKDGFPSAVLTTSGGWKVEIPAASANMNSYPTLSIPYAQRVEQLMDTGMPKVTVDNADTIQKSLAAAGPGAQGCTALSDGRRRPTAGAGLMGLMGLGIGLLLLRRRPRSA
ncbi:MAG TPA: DUF2330 domain-containing protein [Pseudomonadota bacterium]|nr:DUF2330 domain-containing protein [Pseudomonadota bacterium]